MTTVKEVITDALEDITRLSAEEPIQAVDGQAALRYLNDMMTMWAARDIVLGYTVVSDMGDTVTVAPGAIAGIKAHLSIFLAPKFKLPVSQELFERAKQSWKAILNLVIKSPQRRYPSILPTGSGNYYPGTYDTFYPEVDDAIYSETGGLIALEIDTTEA